MRGIYVVILRDGCRVAPLRDIDELFDGYSESMIKYVNREKFADAFGFCVPMTEKEVIECARVMAKGYGELCDGIRVLTDYRNYSFQEISDGAYSKD
jgi:hypothetical protein